MKKLPIALTALDIGAIAVFVVLTLAGIGGWYYFSGELTDAQTAASAANDMFKKYSADKKSNVVVSHKNGMTLQGNIDTLKAQLEPLIQGTFQSKDDKLGAITKEDPVAWKHDLEDQVRRLNVAAKNNNVVVPQNFYFGFGRYQGQSPGDEQTAVLSKQLLGVEQIAGILINAPVSSIQSIRRTYEEDSHGGGAGPGDSDHLPGASYTAPGGVYTAYPFEANFKTRPENLRLILNALIQSPYLLVVRSVTAHSSNSSSPMFSDLDRMAGPPPDTSAISSSPGEVAQTPPAVKGPQFLFGNSTIEVKLRIDMVEWTYQINPPKK